MASNEPTVGIQLRPRLQVTGLQGALSRLSDLSRPLRTRGVQIVRNRVALEFLRRVWFTPSGASRAWRPVTPFGRRLGEGESMGAGKGDKKPMIDSGAYFQALMGRGAGSVVRVTQKTLTVGVDGGTFPYAKYIRGGTGARVRVTDWIIRPRKKVASRGRGRRSWVRQFAMWWYLGLTFGVWLREATLRRGLRLPTRPHMTRHPELVRQIQGLLQRWVTTGRVR